MANALLTEKELLDIVDSLIRQGQSELTGLLGVASEANL